MPKYSVQSPVYVGHRMVKSGEVELSAEDAAPLLARGALAANTPTPSDGGGGGNGSKQSAGASGSGGEGATPPAGAAKGKKGEPK